MYDSMMRAPTMYVCALTLVRRPTCAEVFFIVTL